jgi:peptidoglycan/LPS O-acetylase OafA/YrhL
MAPGSTTGIVVAMTRLPRKPHPPLSTAILGGLAAGALGLVMQFVAEPAKFGVFPPGLYFVAGVMAIVWLGRRWRWSPLAAVALSLWITVGRATTDPDRSSSAFWAWRSRWPVPDGGSCRVSR